MPEGDGGSAQDGAALAAAQADGLEPDRVVNGGYASLSMSSPSSP